MTPAERALLLAVAKSYASFRPSCLADTQQLWKGIAAVEAEAETARTREYLAEHGAALAEVVAGVEYTPAAGTPGITEGVNLGSPEFHKHDIDTLFLD